MDPIVAHRMKQIYKSVNENVEGGDLGDIVDKILFALPFEVHVPFSEGKAQFCGPGTKYAERVARGDKGVNYLDAECKNHDYAYGTYPKGSTQRYQADLNLLKVAHKMGIDPNTTTFNRFIANYVITPAIKFQANANKPKGSGRKRKRKHHKRIGGKITIDELLKIINQPI